jgi:PIN domain nuclease of toxin-antitoxin system
VNLVFDACALIAYLRDEAGADSVEELLVDTNNQCLVHAINLCELYYDFIRAASEIEAQTAVADCIALGLTPRRDMDPTLWQEAARLKARGRLSLADCFAIALTQRVGGELVTSDHREFDPIATAGICPVRFFR